MLLCNFRMKLAFERWFPEKPRSALSVLRGQAEGRSSFWASSFSVACCDICVLLEVSCEIRIGVSKNPNVEEKN